MTKIEFIIKCAERAGLTQKDMTKAVEAFEKTMIEDVFQKEDKVSLKFGTLLGTFKQSKERKARNPKDGSIIIVPPKEVHGFPKFKPAKALKDGGKE